MAKVRNIKDLTESLADQYNKLLKGQISVEQADAVSRMAATMIGACKIQLQYNDLMDNKEQITFLERPTIQVPAPKEPVRGLSEHVLEVLNSRDIPLHESDVKASLLAEGLVAKEYFDRHPEAILRGTLLGMSNSGQIRMTKDQQGRAMFTKNPEDEVVRQGS